MSFGQITAITVDERGDVAFVGNRQGHIYRISGLRNANFEYDSFGDWNQAAAGITVERIFDGPSGFSRTVTGLSVHPEDPDRLLATFSGFNNEENVQYSTNALDVASSVSFSNLGVDIPSFPLYDCLIEEYTGQLMAAGEFGVWVYDPASPSLGWVQEADDIGRVPVFEIRQEPLADLDCRPIYLGTYGRGFWTSISTLDPMACSDVISCFDFTGLDPGQEDIVSPLKLRPNPASAFSMLEFSLEESSRLRWSVFDLRGREVIQGPAAGVLYPAGQSTITVDLNKLETGMYLVVLQSGESVMTKRLLIQR